MKTLKLFLAACAAVFLTFGAGAVTTNRVTVTSTAGTSSVAGSLAYWVKNAPTNGNVLEITIPFDTVCLLDEPLEITSEQSIIIRGENDPELMKDWPEFAALPCGGAIALTHTFYTKKDHAFQVRGFLRLEQMSVGEDSSVEGAGDIFEDSVFFVQGKLEFWRSHIGLTRAVRYGAAAAVRQVDYTSVLFENSTLAVGSDVQTTSHNLDAEGTLLVDVGGRLTMVNCVCASRSSRCAFVIRGTDANSLFVNCSLGDVTAYDGCSILYDNVAEGKHYIVGSRLGFNASYVEKSSGGGGTITKPLSIRSYAKEAVAQLFAHRRLLVLFYHGPSNPSSTARMWY